EEVRTDRSYAFVMKGPAATRGLARILLPEEPEKVEGKDPTGRAIDLQPQWDAKTKTLLVKYPNHPDGVRMTVEF
ncbi:MAG TPA: hypothetical protein PK360_14920, partial [bacterium]|nr:hypothetical protein [bacterium]